MLPDAALVQGAEGGAGPAHGASGVGFVGTAVQQNQVVFAAGATQSRHLAEEAGRRDSDEASVISSLSKML